MEKTDLKFKLKIVTSGPVRVGDIIEFIPYANHDENEDNSRIYRVTEVNLIYAQGKKIPTQGYELKLFDINRYEQLVKEGTIIKHERDGEDRLQNKI